MRASSAEEPPAIKINYPVQHSAAFEYRKKRAALSVFQIKPSGLTFV